MASVTKRGEKGDKDRDGWRVRWRDPDGKARSRSCPTERIARRLAVEVEAALALGRRWTPPAAERALELGGEEGLAALYITDAQRTLAPGTVSNAYSKIGQFLAWLASSQKKGSPIPASKLTRASLEDYDAHLKASGYKESSRHCVLGILVRFWTWCAQREPGGVPPVVRPSMPPPTFPDVVAATWAEVDAVLEMATERARARPILEWVRRLIWLMRCTGWRVSQCFRLEWSDVDLERGTLRLRPELGKTRRERRGRTVPLPPVLSSELARWGKREGWLIGAEIRSTAHASKAVARCWQLARFAGKPMRPELYIGRPDHAFRKTLRTELVRARCSSDAVEHWCGRSVGMREVYTDPRAHDLLEVARAIPAPKFGQNAARVPDGSRSSVTSLGHRPTKRSRAASS